jgi:hypothetical protein
MTQDAYPEICVIAPDMSIGNCYSGHEKIEIALDDVRAHAGR